MGGKGKKEDGRGREKGRVTRRSISRTDIKGIFLEEVEEEEGFDEAEGVAWKVAGRV